MLHWQTVKSQMKCRMRRHFIKVCTVCQDKKQSLGGEIHDFIEMLTGNRLKGTYQSSKSSKMWKKMVLRAKHIIFCGKK